MKKLISLMTIIFAFGFILGGGLVFAKGNPPSKYFIDESKLPFDAMTGATAYWGVHKNAGYRIEVPDDWNGDLVLYAHGYRGTGPELSVSNPSIRNFLIENGFAWAASSYSSNRYDVKAGVKDTHAIGQFFNGLVGNPNRTFVMGHSMGGHISAKIIEQYPNAYDGAMPMCGVMGDTALYDYFISYQLVAQALAGIDAEFPPPPEPKWSEEIVGPMREAFGEPFPTSLTPLGEKLRTVLMHLSGGDRPLFNQAFAYGFYANYTLGINFTDTSRGIAAGGMMENINTIYQLDSDPELTPEEQALNDMVLRVEADPQGKRPNGLSNIPPVTGDITIPVISLHTMGDLYVPLLMQQIYAERVAEQGKSDLLVQRVVRHIGHCGFDVQEEIDAFIDLLIWVDNGVIPGGDDILDPDNVSDSDFGCKFSRGAHSAGCP